MNQLIKESVVKLAESLQLPERVFHVEELPF